MVAAATHVQTRDTRYRFNDFSLEGIRNRQEVRVADMMRTMLPEAEGFCGCRLCVEDVFALSLNSLPPHYVQSGSFLVRSTDPSEATLREVLQIALDRVGGRPNHP